MNIAEILKNVPRGTKIYSPAFGEVTFMNVCCDFINVKDPNKIERAFYSNGNFCRGGECVLFPSKENRDWSKFTTCPFKDGDVISKTYSDGRKYIAIFSHIGGVTPETLNYHCYVRGDGMVKIGKDYGIGVYTEYKLASEKDREFLFKRLIESGYYWNTCTKSIKLSNLKFKVGDTIHKEGYPNYTILAIEEDRYKMKNGFFLKFVDQHEWEIKEIRKFDIKELKPFDKVLVRDNDTSDWYCNFYSHYRNTSFYKYGCTSSAFSQCIPYNDDTKHLVGTNKECPEYYKTWE